MSQGTWRERLTHGTPARFVAAFVIMFLFALLVTSLLHRLEGGTVGDVWVMSLIAGASCAAGDNFRLRRSEHGKAH